MRRNLVLLSLLLAGLIGLAGWRLKTRYEERLKAEAEFLRRPVPVGAAPVVVLPPEVGQVSGVTYLKVAEQLVFSKDRNPTVVIEVAPPKPMPALPRFYGMMNFGAGPRVILASAPGGAQKSYAVGDGIGEFKLKTVAQSGLVFEWDGKEVPASYAEMKDATGGAPAEAQASAGSGGGGAPPPQATGGVKQLSSVTSVSSADLAKPGAETATGIRGCQPGDTTPAGAVVDGYRKLMTETPFGKSCRWEKVQ